MSKAEWEAIDPKIRDMVIAAFGIAGIDFEAKHISPDRPERSTDTSTSPWLTREEAARYSKCSTDTIDNWIAKGYIVRAKLDASRPGGVLIDRASLEAFLRSKVVNPKTRIRKAAPSVQGGYRVNKKHTK